jgi:hypothetical protein
LVVGWLALRLSACEFGSAGAGLHFVMRSDRMAVCGEEGSKWIAK